MKKSKWLVILFVTAGLAFAQRYYDRRGVPDWKPDEEFSNDVFTFVRIRYSSGYDGFLMVDDFWGEDEWFNFYYEIKRVFPDRELVELELDHPVFHAVFDLKERPQIPSIGHALGGRGYGITWERDDAREVHYKAIFDDKGRMMTIICH